MTNEDVMTKMSYAQPNQNMCPYYYPIVPADEVFVRLHPVFPKVRDIYWISNYGRLYNEKSGYMIAEVNDKGYIAYGLSRDPNYPTTTTSPVLLCQAQILVALAFIGPRPSPIHQVNHIDCNPHNNYYMNLEWVTPAENLEHSRNLGHYHNPDGSYKNSIYKKEDIEKLCEYMQMGITDPQQLSQLVFGEPATYGVLALIRDLKSGRKWTFVTKNYDIPDVDHRNFVNDEFITRVCELFQNTPGSIDWPHRQILDAIGVDSYVQDDKVFHRFKSAISQIKKRKAYARIVSQYTF